MGKLLGKWLVQASVDNKWVTVHIALTEKGAQRAAIEVDSRSAHVLNKIEGYRIIPASSAKG